MNCRQGDLAIVIEAAPRGDYRGLIVEVLEYRGIYDYITTHFSDQLPGTVKWWVRSSRPVRCASGIESREFLCADIFLRPIRPQVEGTVDEMVQRVGPAPMTLTEILQGVSHG